MIHDTFYDSNTSVSLKYCRHHHSDHSTDETNSNIYVVTITKTISIGLRKRQPNVEQLNPHDDPYPHNSTLVSHTPIPHPLCPAAPTTPQSSIPPTPGPPTKPVTRSLSSSRPVHPVSAAPNKLSAPLVLHNCFLSPPRSRRGCTALTSANYYSPATTTVHLPALPSPTSPHAPSATMSSTMYYARCMGGGQGDNPGCRCTVFTQPLISGTCCSVCGHDLKSHVRQNGPPRLGPNWPLSSNPCSVRPCCRAPTRATLHPLIPSILVPRSSFAFVPTGLHMKMPPPFWRVFPHQHQHSC